MAIPGPIEIGPGTGALGGLYTALSVAHHPLVAVIACDMPFVSPALLTYQLELLQKAAVDAVIPRTPHGLEPFHAIYRQETCLPLIRTALEAEQRRVDAWFARANICYLTPDEITRHDPRGLAFLNVNTPQELAAAIQLAG